MQYIISYVRYIQLVRTQLSFYSYISQWTFIAKNSMQLDEQGLNSKVSKESIGRCHGLNNTSSFFK